MCHNYNVYMAVFDDGYIVIVTGIYDMNFIQFEILIFFLQIRYKLVIELKCLSVLIAFEIWNINYNSLNMSFKSINVYICINI